MPYGLLVWILGKVFVLSALILVVGNFLIVKSTHVFPTPIRARICRSLGAQVRWESGHLSSSLWSQEVVGDLRLYPRR
ncbi:hypothetical protein J6590_031968 [Homalodisca vitripennis]|nr:hypothetical protein J6590_031968 [Homalodisca vitripennis]